VVLMLVLERVPLVHTPSTRLRETRKVVLARCENQVVNIPPVSTGHVTPREPEGMFSRRNVVIARIHI
jgi:hypothetical protein